MSVCPTGKRKYSYSGTVAVSLASALKGKTTAFEGCEECGSFHIVFEIDSNKKKDNNYSPE